MKEIFYQLALRSFTPEGTLQAATERLEHISDLGVTVIYLCPCFVADDDPDMTFWSKRQIASGTMNPKNPYKITDYNNVDSEYGCNDDLVAFISKAHKLGLKVILDLVYLHCGRNAVFIKEHPDFVLRNEDGSTLVGATWPFARLNFASRELRDYLIANMKRHIEYFDCDGFRCDVGNLVPVDFWEEAFAKMKRIKNNLIFLNEGDLNNGRSQVFDIGYNWNFREKIINIIQKDESALILKDYIQDPNSEYRSRSITFLDNHDTASDSVIERCETTLTSLGMDTAYVVMYTLGGHPLIWNGHEFADNAENCMFANRMHTKRSEINWSRAFTEYGKRRLKLVKSLSKLYFEHSAMSSQIPSYLENSASDDVISYIKSNGEENLLVAVNLRDKEATAKFDCQIVGDILLSDGANISENQTIAFKPFGYTIIKL